MSQQYKHPAEAITLLEGVIKGLADSTQRVTDQPALFLRMHIAQNRLQMGEVEECKTLVEQGKEQLDRMHDVSRDLMVMLHVLHALGAHAVRCLAWMVDAEEMQCANWDSAVLRGCSGRKAAWCHDWGCGRLQSCLEVWCKTLLGKGRHQLVRQREVRSSVECTHEWCCT